MPLEISTSFDQRPYKVCVCVCMCETVCMCVCVAATLVIGAVHICMHIRVYTCAQVLYISEAVGEWGGEAVSMVTPDCHPQWALKDKASHVHAHTYTHAHRALQGQLSQINISPHLKNRIQRMAFQRSGCTLC